MSGSFLTEIANVDRYPTLGASQKEWVDKQEKDFQNYTMIARIVAVSALVLFAIFPGLMSVSLLFVAYGAYEVSTVTDASQEILGIWMRLPRSDRLDKLALEYIARNAPLTGKLFSCIFSR